LCKGRSAANSAVCYCLEITAIDPVGMELLFERFLSESRNEWPDIDLDLPSEEKRELSMRILDLPRHLGQHSGGMVICQGQLNQVVPLERASMPGRTVIQWDKEDCADMGIIKVDLLGLGMMAVLHDCLELIPAHYGEKVDLAQLPQDDEVYRVLQKADTVGMFQIESRAQMASLPRTHPECFYHIVVNVAIIRPGPIVGGMVHPYMRRRQGKEEVTYPHPSLEPVLKRTLGVPLFQEQLLRIAMTVADFSGAEADELRRAVGMRRSWERMKNLEGRLRAGMTAKGINTKTQDTIVQHISSFALYGFPESHAASFALIIKYLAAFTAAILNNQPMGFYSPAVLVKDAQRHDLRVKPIDVQISDWLCTVEHEDDGRLSLRIGLGYAKSLTRQSAEALVASRRKDGPFLSADDLTWRVPSLNRRELTRLAQIGAMNQLNGIEHRRDALWQVERAGKLEGPLFRQNTQALREDSDALPLQKMGIEERLVADYVGTGLTVGKHPMHYRRAELRRNNILSAEELRTRTDGEFVRTAGCVIARQRPGTAKGFIFISMEDETGKRDRHARPLRT
jgi:error-prone DNA polymerase